MLKGELLKQNEEKLFERIPILRYRRDLTGSLLRAKASEKKYRLSKKGQMKFPGQGASRGGRGYGRHPSYPGTPQQYPYAGYSGRSPMPGGHRGAEGSEGYYQGDESYDYQQGASDDSRDTQHSSGGHMGQQQQQPPMGFAGEFGDNSSSQQGFDQTTGDTSFLQDRKQVPEASGGVSSNTGGGGQDQGAAGKSPPDIKYEVTPMSFIKRDDFELIEIDPDEEDEL